MFQSHQSQPTNLRLAVSKVTMSMHLVICNLTVCTLCLFAENAMTFEQSTTNYKMLNNLICISDIYCLKNSQFTFSRNAAETAIILTII